MRSMIVISGHRFKTSSICTQKEYLIMLSLTPYYKALQRKWDISLLFHFIQLDKLSLNFKSSFYQ